MPGAVAALLATVVGGDPDSWDAGVFGWLGLRFPLWKPPSGVSGRMPCLGLQVVGLGDRRGGWVIEREAERRTQRFSEFSAGRVANLWPFRQCLRQDAVYRRRKAYPLCRQRRWRGCHLGPDDSRGFVPAKWRLTGQ
jgi:hypothetical protein